MMNTGRWHLGTMAVARHLGLTPSVSDLEIVLDKIWVKHWGYKSLITFKLLSLQM
jgi:hypothetical protein